MSNCCVTTSHLLGIVALCAAACSSGASSQGGSIDAGVPAGDSSAGFGDAGDTWNSWAQAFFTKYCVECHAPSDPTGRDFTKKAVVVSNAPTIRCGVCNAQDPSWGCTSSPHAQQFPIADANNTNPKPTSVERDRVVAWISAGSP
jgi:hypothetical protein